MRCVQDSLRLRGSTRPALLFIAVVGLLLMQTPAQAGKLTLQCWEFNRGNAKVMDNPAKYGDYRDKHPDLMLIAGDEQPWFVEYDLEFPTNGTYSVHTRFASAGEYPLEVLIDGKRVGQICLKETGNNPPYWDLKPNVFEEGTPIRKWHLHGVEWEWSEIEVTKGKHTLKLMRNGPPANPIKIELSADGPAPTRTTLPDADVVLARIPVKYRNVFLFRDGRSVNIEGLRLAIKDHIKTFGPQYPRGAQYLQELEALEKRSTATAGGGPEQQQELHDAWTTLRQKALLDHPALKVDKLLFTLKKYRSVSTYTGHIGAGNDGGSLCMLSPVAPDGKVTPLVPELTNGVFGRFDLSFDATRVLFCYAESGGSYSLYEIDIDPVTGLRPEGSRLRQLSASGYADVNLGGSYGRDGGFNDIDPVYLPNGKIMFASTRCQRSVLCFPASVTALHVMDSDGKNIECISQGQVNENSLCVLDDGRVAYMRWEYVDKGFANVQSLWAVRPDGSGSDHVFKNDLVAPAAIMHARSVPNSRKLVATATGHHGGHHGPIVLIDNRRHRRFADALDNLTPEIRYPAMGQIRYAPYGNTGTWRDPYPFSETFFLASHQPARIKYPEKAEFGLYTLDAWGNRAEVYRHPEFSCRQPVPLQPRPRPTDVAAVTPPAATEKQDLATMFVSDVYQGLDGIERGRVKYIRVMEAMNLGWYDTWRAGVNGDGYGQQASVVSAGGDVARKYVHGIATVREDGSAMFTVPADKNLFFQALDENYMELHRMRTFINFMPGEKRSCVGCHEFRRKAPNLAAKAKPQALDHPVEALYAQPGDAGPRAVHYPRDVQPILDTHCISCHSGKTPKSGLVLTGEPDEKFFTRSYQQLTHFDGKKRLISYLHTSGFGGSHVPLEPPLSFGSHRSLLVTKLLAGHPSSLKAPPGQRAKTTLSQEEFIKIVTWIDSNAPFYGTHDGKKNIRWKAEPDFRPNPVVVTPAASAPLASAPLAAIASPGRGRGYPRRPPQVRT